MNKVLLIGNSGTRSNGTDGQTVKVRLYLKKIKDEGFDVEFVDLENFSRKPIRTLHSIRKNIKKCDRIILITAERGAKILIPFINRINHKYKKPFIFPLIGISVLHYSIDKLSDKEKTDFLVNHNYALCKRDKRIIKQLSKMTAILPETELLTEVFKDFYGLKNVYQLNNFRDVKQIQHSSDNHSGGLRLVYVSRVMAVKGILDLLDVVKQLNKEGVDVYLDIYGNKYLTEEENNTFNSCIDNKFINYKGILKPEYVCETISEYDLFAFPTKYYGEGTPGVVVESLIAGTPVLTSDFPQVKYLLKDGFDSIFYKMLDKEALKDKLIYLANSKDALEKIKINARSSGEKYTYDYERDLFLKYVCGIEKKILLKDS